MTVSFLMAAPVLVSAGTVVLFDAGEFDRAAEAAQAELRGNPGDVPALVLLGRAQLAAGRVLEAVRTLRHASAGRPASAEAHYRLGQALVTQASEGGTLRWLTLSSDIGGAFQQAVDLEPANPEYRWALFEFCRHAPGFLGGGRRRAEHEAQALARLDAARGHRARAALLLQDEETGAAETELLAAVAAAPDVADHRYALGYHHQNVKNWPAAFDVFTAIAQRFPAETQAWYQIGKTAALSGENLETGAAALRRYLQHRPRADDPPLSWTRYRLGQVYEHLGQRAAAAREYQAALALNPGHPRAGKALRALQR